MKKIYSLFLFSGACFNVCAAPTIGILPNISSEGVGVEMQIKLNNDFGLRAGLNQFDYGKNMTRNILGNQADVYGNLHEKSKYLLFDYYLFDSNWRISPGFFQLNNYFTAYITPGPGTITYNGMIVNASDVQSINGKIQYQGIKPYLGLGYDSFKDGEGFYFSFDVGVIKSDSPQTSLISHCSSSTIYCDTIQNQTKQEAQNLSDYSRKYNVLPFIKMGAGYRF